MVEIDELRDAAEATVYDFIESNHAGAIPALIGVCTMWAVQNGATDLIKSTLNSALIMADEMAAEIQSIAQ